MNKVAVVGVGSTRFSGPQEKTEIELFAEAATDAIAESNLKPKDIKALFIGNALGDFEEGQGMLQAYAAENIGCRYAPANRYEGACASASMAIRDAFIWVASGYYVLGCPLRIPRRRYLPRRFRHAGASLRGQI
jgi:acetyl-CoA C-acetyltransferase/acetyl-CoA acyltransferase